MKRISLFLVMIYAVSFTFGQTNPAENPDPIHSVLVFNSSLENMVKTENIDAPGSSTRYHVLRLSIRSVRVLSAESEEFKAEINCVEARWLDRNTLVSREAVILVVGNRFRDRVLISASDTPGTISPNRPALVLVKPLGTRPSMDGSVPLLSLVDIKSD